MAEKKAFSVAMKEYFGFLPGETLKGFFDELKALTPADKQEFANGLRAQGIDCADPTEASHA